MEEKRGVEEASVENRSLIKEGAPKIGPESEKKSDSEKKIFKKKSKEDPKKILHDSTNKKISYLMSKSDVQEEEVYALVKEFFKKYLDIDYEFTHTELMDELRKVYLEKELLEKLEDFLKKIAVIECFDNNFSLSELKKMLDKFEKLSKDLVGPVEKQKTENLFNKFLKSFKREKRQKKSKLERKEEKIREKKHLELLPKKSIRVVKPEPKKSEGKPAVSASKQTSISASELSSIPSPPSALSSLFAEITTLQENVGEKKPVEKKKKPVKRPKQCKALKKKKVKKVKKVKKKKLVEKRHIKKIKLKEIKPSELESIRLAEKEKPVEKRHIKKIKLKEIKLRVLKSGESPEKETSGKPGPKLVAETGKTPKVEVLPEVKIPKLLRRIRRKVKAEEWDEAKTLYVELLEVYESTDKATKHKYYSSIYSLYSTLAI